MPRFCGAASPSSSNRPYSFSVRPDRIARSRLAGDPPDVTISPHVGKIGLFEFHRAAEAIALGREAVSKALDPLEHSIERLA